MSSTKIKFAFFTIPEYEKEQEWLHRQHLAGWKLENATVPGFYTFCKCEPEDVVYQLDYNPEGMEHMQEYVQMFKDCGWEYITDMVGYSYFRKPVSHMMGEEEIFCDEDSKMDMIERVFKGRMIPLIIIFFLIIIPQLFSQNGILLAIFIALFILYLTVFIKFAVQYARLKKRMGR